MSHDAYDEGHRSETTDAHRGRRRGGADPVRGRRDTDRGRHPGTGAAPAAGGGATVRLITGDRVTARTDVTGHRTASVTPGEGRRHLLFRTVEEDGHLTALPSDAAGLVTAGRLDRGLFDVTALIAQGHDRRRGPRRTGRPLRPPDGHRSRRLGHRAHHAQPVRPRSRGPAQGRLLTASRGAPPPSPSAAPRPRRSDAGCAAGPRVGEAGCARRTPSGHRAWAG